jgi:AbrB family looped-hinge helix DNA binding protein
MLARPEGATMSELIAATGGPQYNVLRRLKAKGRRVRKVREGTETRYWVETAVSSYEVEVNAKGQATIPKEVRSRVGLSGGSKVQLTVEDGRIVMRPCRTSIRDSLGAFHRKGRKAATMADIDAAIVAGAIEGALGKKRRAR